MNLSRKLGLSVVILAVMATVLASPPAAGQKNPPKMVISNKSPDLGTFYEGVDIEYEFTVRNTGLSELHILGVRPG
jgi:hypothetical protein